MDATADAASERLSAFTARCPDQLPEAADDTTNGRRSTTVAVDGAEVKHGDQKDLLFAGQTVTAPSNDGG